jgi:peptide deformylase
MSVREILLLGNPKLYEVCHEVRQEELESLTSILQDLHDTLFDFRGKYIAGRAIAAPQIGVMKRIVYMHIDSPVVLINPIIDQKSDQLITVWDDCMSFPELLVKVERHKSCRLSYYDQAWQRQSLLLEDDISELLQHECDHLDGILAVSRALDAQSFAWRTQRKFL